MTSKGQLTLPKAVRERLRVKPGDLIDFVVTESGDIHVRAGQFDVTDLRGMLRKAGRKAASLEDMDAAIQRGLASRP